MKKSLGCSHAAIAFASMAVLYGCGQQPSFSENKRTTRVDLSVNDADATEAKPETSAEQSAEHLNGMEDDEIKSIFNSLGGAEEGGSETLESSSKDAQGNSKFSKSSGDSEKSLSGQKKNSDDREVLGADATASEIIADGSEPLPPDNSSEELIQTPNKAELSACAKLNGVSASSLKVVGNKSSAKISSNSVVVIKVAGNQSDLELSLRGPGSIAGICIFVTGNKGKARVNLSTGLGNFIYRGRGNQSSGILNIEEGGSVVNILANLNGNDAKLEVSGFGNCRSARVVGNSSAFTCN